MAEGHDPGRGDGSNMTMAARVTMELLVDNHRIDNPIVTRDLEDLKNLTGLLPRPSRRWEPPGGGPPGDRAPEAALRAQVVRHDSRRVHHEKQRKGG